MNGNGPDDPGMELLRRMRGSVQASYGDPGLDLLAKMRGGSYDFGGQFADEGARYNTARGRRDVEAEAIQRQIEQYKKSYATASGEHKQWLQTQIDRLEKEQGFFHLAPTAGESLKRFGGGVVAGPSQMLLSIADLAAAPVQMAESVLGRDAQWGRGLRSWIAERQALIEEATGSQGPEGLVGNLVGGIIPAATEAAAYKVAATGVPILADVARGVGASSRIINLGGHGYAKLANATLRFMGKAGGPLEKFARASFEGNAFQRAAGNIVADLPWNAAQIASMDDVRTEDIFKSLGFSAVGSGVGGVLSPRIQYDKPKFKPKFDTGDAKANNEEYAGEMNRQIRLIQQWQEANPGKAWTDMPQADRDAVLNIHRESTPHAVAVADKNLVTLSDQLRGFILGDNNDVEVARRAYAHMKAMGADENQLWSLLGITVQDGIPVSSDGRNPIAERMDLASGAAGRPATAKARVESDSKKNRSARMQQLLQRARQDLKAERVERRKAQREALADPLVPEIQGARAWQQAMPSIEADEGTYIAKFDLNNFKALNDALGQSAGDEVIRSVGQAIAATAQAGKTRSFRIGGDEFVVAGPLDAVSQVRTQIESMLYGAKFQDQVISISGGIGQTLREAELDLRPRKVEAKRSLNQPLSREDNTWFKEPIHEIMPTVQVFKAVKENGLEDIVRAAVKQSREGHREIDASTTKDLGIEIVANNETEARNVLGQYLDMTSQGIAKDKALRVLSRQYQVDPLDAQLRQLKDRMRGGAASMPKADLSQMDPWDITMLADIQSGVGTVTKDGIPHTANIEEIDAEFQRRYLEIRKGIEEAKLLGNDAEVAPLEKKLASLDGAYNEFNKRKDTYKQIQSRREGRTTAGGARPTDSTIPRGGVSRGSTDVSRTGTEAGTTQPPGRPNGVTEPTSLLDRIANGEGQPAVRDDSGKIWTSKRAAEHGDLATYAEENGAVFSRNAYHHDGWIIDGKFVSTYEVEPHVYGPLEHPVAKALEEVPDKKARWNELEDKLEDLEPGTEEFDRIQAEANQLWAEIDALDGFSDARPGTEEPTPAATSNPEPPPATKTNQPSPLELESTTLPAPLEEMGPNEIEGLIDKMLAPFDRNPELLGGKAHQQVQRDVARLRDQSEKIRATQRAKGDLIHQPADTDRLTELINKPFADMEESEFTELNILLQQRNNQLAPGAPGKDEIVDKLIELRHYQQNKEENKWKGRTSKSQASKDDIDDIFEQEDIHRINPNTKEAGFTSAEALAAVTSVGVGGLLGYAYPADSEEDRFRNALLAAGLAGAGAAGLFYMRGKIKGGQKLRRGPSVPGEDKIHEVMRTTIFDDALADMTPNRIVRGIWEGMDKLYARTLRPSLGGERIARTLALGARIGKQVGDVLATFGINRRVAMEWMYRGPRELDVTTGQFKDVFVTRDDGTVAPVRPVANIIGDVGGDIERLGSTALALSAVEQYIKYGRVPHPSLNPVELAKFLNHVDPKFLAAAQQMRDVHLGLLDMQVKAGIISPELRKKLGAEEFYTAMERIFGDGMEQSFGKKVGDRLRGLFAQRPVKARKGPNEFDIRNPVETLWIAIARTAKAVELNEKKASLIALWEASNVPDEVKLAFMRPATKTQTEHAQQSKYQHYIQQMKSLLPNLTQAEAQQMIDVFDPLPLGPKSDFMTFLRNGKSEVWRLSPELVETFGYMQGWDVHDFWRVIGVGSNTARKGTALSPDFVGRVAFFDVFQSYMNSEHGVRPGLDWLSAFYNAWKKSPEYLDWGGGLAEASLLEDIRNPRDILRRSQAEGKTVGADIAKNLSLKNWHPVEAYKRLLVPFAEAGRFSEYLAARRHGASVQESIRASLAVGGYFNQVGSYAAGLFHAVPFAKGIAQSLDQTIYSAGIHPFRAYDGNRTVKAIKWFGKGAASIALPTAFFYFANADDEEITQLRQSEAGRRSWFFRLPTGGIMSIRKPAGPEGQLFGTGFEIFMDKLRGKEPAAWEQFRQTMMNEIQVPWLPPAVQAAVTLGTGTDVSFGSPLISERLRSLPTNRQTYSSTSGVAETLSEIGTSVGEPSGFWERALSPIGIDYIARTLGGTLAKEAFQLADMGRQWSEYGTVPAAREWPVMRRFMGPDLTRAQTRDMEDFYNFADKAEKIVGGLNQSLRSADVQGFVDITERWGAEKIAASRMILSVRSQLAGSQRAIEELRKAEGGDVDARRQIILSIRRSVLRQMGQALSAARAIQD